MKKYAIELLKTNPEGEYAEVGTIAEYTNFQEAMKVFSDLSEQLSGHGLAIEDEERRMYQLVLKNGSRSTKKEVMDYFII